MDESAKCDGALYKFPVAEINNSGVSTAMVAAQSNKLVSDVVVRIEGVKHIDDDHKKGIAKLQEIIEQYNNWLPGRVSKETAKVLDRIGKHLSRAQNHA